MSNKSLIAAAVLTGLAMTAQAQQTTIDGPPGSVAFGKAVLALPNGNIVVTDPEANGGAGGVHLYTPAGVKLGTLSGSTSTDHVGSGGVVGVGDNHFVVVSPDWSNGVATKAGAVTWINGATGLTGFVSSANSLVGSTTNDEVGLNGTLAITVLTNGNYVVNSWAWGTGGLVFVGAVTWANGNTGITGPVSSANSLVGTVAGDAVGSSRVRALSNGNYVVASPGWSNGGVQNVGAVTWANGATGRIGSVSTSNSLVGSKTGDLVGANVEPLANGNYVVGSSSWDNGVITDAGAVTLGDGAVGRVGVVSAANSAVGSHADDSIGESIIPLTDGDYVVSSWHWDNAAIADAGVARWCDGVAGCIGAFTIANSLIGTTANDNVGYSVIPLANGNYVVSSSLWTNGALTGAGAVTWGNGVGGTKGAVAAANSFVGTKANDRIGVSGVTALANGNYVIGSYLWKNGALSNAGAATWGNGSTGLVGTVTVGNSLLGSSAGDQVGHDVLALANGHYVVGSSFWGNAGLSRLGAVTWGNGVTGATVGAVSAANSLVGTKAQDQVGDRLFALSNGNYVVGSRYWDNGAAVDAGAITWVNGTKAYLGTVSIANSFVGGQNNDNIGVEVFAFADGSYAPLSFAWDLGPFVNSGAATLSGGHYRLRGDVQPWNSVIPPLANGGAKLYIDYDLPNERLIVGRPAENKVTLFRRDQLFADSFD